MCDCITETDDLLRKQGLNTKIGVTMPYRQINGRMFIAVRASVETLKADTSVRKKPTGMIANYCPFCGKKYATFEEMAEEAELLAKFPQHAAGAYTYWCGTCGGYAGFSLSGPEYGSHLGLAKNCDQQEKQGNIVRYEAPGTVSDYRECVCHADPEEEDDTDDTEPTMEANDARP